jgi:uncharacterized membrane protein
VSPRSLTAAGIVLLFALPFVWHLLLDPPQQIPAWLAVTLHAAPMLPAVILLLRRHRTAAFWGGVAALFLFCHGVMEAWATPTARVPALAEVALSVMLILASSWDGVRARLARRR